MGELGAAILNTCAPAGNRRAVQELAFNKLRFIEVSRAMQRPAAETTCSVNDAGPAQALIHPAAFCLLARTTAFQLSPSRAPVVLRQ